jgi:hypothetical protein
VESTLQRFQSLEKGAVPRQSGNWRLQMALYRAYYDAYVQRRLVHENAAEQAALDALRAGVPARAERILDEAAAQPPAPDLRARVLALAEALFQSARMQLSVGRYGAISRDRGATLDNLDVPLSNAAWIRIHLSEALAWTDPGPGGFYDDLGNPARSPHLLRPSSYEDDPAFTRLPRTGFTRNPFAAPAWRVSWLNHAETLYDAPLRMKYDGLDPAAQYKVRVVYGGEPGPARVMRLTAGSHELHAFRLIENVTQPVEFDIPAAATVSGSLTLEWTGQPGAGGNGRVCQVAEVWLLRH